MLDSGEIRSNFARLALGMIDFRWQTFNSSHVNDSKRHMFGNPTYQGESNSLGIEWSISSILADALLIDQRRKKPGKS